MLSVWVKFTSREERLSTSETINPQQTAENSAAFAWPFFITP
jgi:hypothetical protein